MSMLDKKEFYELACKHPLFKQLSDGQKKDLYQSCEIKRFDQADIILQANKRREGLFLLLEGNAEVYTKNESSDRVEVLEVIQAGHLIGLSSIADFLGESSIDSPQLNVEVRSVTESHCLYIPFSVLEARWEDLEVRDYILRKIAVRLRDIYGSLAEQVNLSRQWGESEPFIRRVQDLMSSPVMSIEAGESIKNTAIKMNQHSLGSILILEQKQLVGIITERDLVERVIANSISLDESNEKIMTKNPYTISPYDYYYQALSEFLLKGVKYLPVVEDGKVLGIITLSDLLRKKNQSMVNTIKKIEQADERTIGDVKQAIYYVLGTLIQDKVPILHTLEVVTSLFDRLAQHSIELAIQSLEKKGAGKPPVAFSWYMMGSAGRGEQFLLTDQDHFLVYEDVKEQDKEQVEAYFESLGNEIVHYMELAGYERCKGKMMSSELVWRGSLNTWQERLRRWSLRATNDTLLLAQNFFSFRFLYGDTTIHDSFVEMIKKQMKSSKIFLYRLAQVEKTQQVPLFEHPIRSLFGLDKKQMDIKKDSLFPFHHALQIISLGDEIIEGTPLQRLQRLVDKKLITESFYEDLKESFSIVMRIYVYNKWASLQRGEASTSIVKFTHLTTKEKENIILAQRMFRSLQNQMLSEFSL